MALVFNNDLNNAIMSDMAWNVGGLLGRGIPAGLGFGAKMLGGHQYEQNVLEDGKIQYDDEGKPITETKYIQGLFGTPTKDQHGKIPLDKWLQGGFKKSGDGIIEGQEVSEIADEDLSYTEKQQQKQDELNNEFSILAGGSYPDDNKINELESSLEEDPGNIANNTELSKLKNKKEAIKNSALKKFASRYEIGNKKWAPGKLAGIALAAPFVGAYKAGEGIYGGIRDNIAERRIRADERREEKANMREQELLTGSSEEKQGLLQKIFKGGKKKKTKDYGSGVSEYIPADVSEEENIAANIQETGEGMVTSEMVDNYAPELQDLNFPGPASEEQLQEVMDNPEDYGSGESLYVPPKASTYQDNYNAYQDRIKQLEQSSVQNNEPPVSLLDRAAAQEQLDSGLDNYDSTLAVDTGALDNVDTSNVRPIETDPNMHLSFPENDIGGPLGGALGGALNPTQLNDNSGKPKPGYTNQQPKIAISPEEPDTLGNRNNNPGNIKFAGQKGALKEGDFAKFNSMEEGWQALYNQIELDAGRGDTITTFIKGKDGTGGYSEDNQEAYIQHIVDKTGYPADTPINMIDPQILASAIAHMEGTLDHYDFAPSMDELAPANNRNPLDAIIQKGIMPIDMDSIRQQTLQKQDYMRKIRGY